MVQSYAGAGSIPGVKYSRLTSGEIDHLARTSPHDVTLLEELLVTLASRRTKRAKDAQKYIQGRLRNPGDDPIFRNLLRKSWNWFLSELRLVTATVTTALITGFATGGGTWFFEEYWRSLLIIVGLK